MQQKENKIELLKSRNGDFDNLYVRIGDGYPVQIKLAFFNGKVMRFLLANATPFKVERKIKVAEGDASNENPLADDDGVISEDAENA